MLTNDVETNKYALMLSEEDQMYLEQEEGLAELGQESDKKKNVCKYMCFKLKLVCKALKEPTLMRVYSYMIL